MFLIISSSSSSSSSYYYYYSSSSSYSYSSSSSSCQVPERKAAGTSRSEEAGAGGEADVEGVEDLGSVSVSFDQSVVTFAPDTPHSLHEEKENPTSQGTFGDDP
jgi:hypothetical protein